MSSMGLFAPIGEVDMKSAPPMLTVAAVETIRSALVIWRRCSIARAAPAQALGMALVPLPVEGQIGLEAAGVGSSDLRPSW
jgi:hypothetical protein